MAGNPPSTDDWHRRVAIALEVQEKLSLYTENTVRFLVIRTDTPGLEGQVGDIRVSVTLHKDANVVTLKRKDKERTYRHPYPPEEGVAVTAKAILDILFNGPLKLMRNIPLLDYTPNKTNPYRI